MRYSERCTNFRICRPFCLWKSPQGLLDLCLRLFCSVSPQSPRSPGARVWRSDFFNFGLFFILFSFLYLKIRWNFDSLPHLSGPNMIVYGVLSVSCRRSRSWWRSWREPRRTRTWSSSPWRRRAAWRSRRRSRARSGMPPGRKNRTIENWICFGKPPHIAEQVASPHGTWKGASAWQRQHWILDCFSISFNFAKLPYLCLALDFITSPESPVRASLPRGSTAQTPSYLAMSSSAPSFFACDLNIKSWTSTCSYYICKHKMQWWQYFEQGFVWSPWRDIGWSKKCSPCPFGTKWVLVIQSVHEVVVHIVRRSQVGNINSDLYSNLEPRY